MGRKCGWRTSKQKITLAFGNCYNDFYFLFLDFVMGYRQLVTVLVLKCLGEGDCEMVVLLHMGVEGQQSKEPNRIMLTDGILLF